MTTDIQVRQDPRANGLAKMLLGYRGTFERLLPAHLDADTFVGLAAGAFHRNPDLAAAAVASPESLLVALRDCARLGHQPGTDQYALTVRKRKGHPEILGIEQYQGVIERMYRAGAVLAVHAEVVCQGERFEPQGALPPIHEADWLGRDPTAENLVGVYAYATLAGGVCSRVVVMGRPEVMRHRAYAATTAMWDGPFAKSFWLKTAAHELEKWCPTSAEYRTEVARAQAVLAREAPAQSLGRGGQPFPDEPAGAIVSGEVVPDDPPAVEDWPETAQPPDGAR